MGPLLHCRPRHHAGALALVLLFFFLYFFLFQVYATRFAGIFIRVVMETGTAVGLVSGSSRWSVGMGLGLGPLGRAACGE